MWQEARISPSAVVWCDSFQSGAELLAEHELKLHHYFAMFKLSLNFFFVGERIFHVSVFKKKRNDS